MLQKHRKRKQQIGRVPRHSHASSPCSRTQNRKFGVSCVHCIIQILQFLLSCVHCIIQTAQFKLRTLLSCENSHSGLSPFPGEYSAQLPFYRCAHANSITIPFASYWVPTYTPGSRAAMWIKCLAEGHKYWVMAGTEPGLSEWEMSAHTNIPQ